MSPYQSPLLVAPDFQNEIYLHVSPASAGWDFLHFAARKLKRGAHWSHQTGENELALVVLGGVCRVTSDRGDWDRIGRRKSVFDGMPYTLYLPRQTQFSVEAASEEVDFAYGWCA